MDNPQNLPRLSRALCQEILNCELQIQIGNSSQELVCRTIELYVEAMSIYMNYSLTVNNQVPSNANGLTVRGYEYYQQKIKKLLMRKDVQQCLVGQKTNPKALNLQLQLSKVKESAPQQAKALINYFKKFHQQQEDFINKTVKEQNSKLQERIASRSRSRSNGLHQMDIFLANL